tara:strand:- start:4729 stop:5475 length:747 start_codon:yes stop_codon:yes gene_type:complete
MITTILNCYRRPTYLYSQIEAILNQTVGDSEIWVWRNYHEDFDDKFNWEEFKHYCKDKNVKLFDTNHNWKYCGRFAAACLVDTEYTAIFDDDTIPGNRWFENCISTLQTHRGILGGVGVILQQDNSYLPNQRIGWSTNNEQVAEVDLVGHSWFYPSEFNKYIWMEKPMWENGEDMHFSAMAQIYGDIKTYVPAQPSSDSSLSSSLHGMAFGMDAVASSHQRNHERFYTERTNCVKKLINRGWNLMKDR